jgi:2-amino-4-hydroxy-6-hydroxymethyldihydropteridine diphosphokinase
MGDRENYLRSALALLGKKTGVRVEMVSSIYETDPVGFTEQPAFLNVVTRIETSLMPEELLLLCMETEKHLQRERTIKWGPRTVDVDILLYDELEINLPHLYIPHPLMGERLFVLIPLAELDDTVAWKGKTVKQRLREFASCTGIRLLKSW